jgi:hypothetical protein
MWVENLMGTLVLLVKEEWIRRVIETLFFLPGWGDFLRPIIAK